jgi:tRNA uridine 5-carboxymethylaminomethyl modification enzyme
VNSILQEAEAGSISEPVKAVELLKRPGVEARVLAEAGEAPFRSDGMRDALTAVEVEVKYEGYINREVERAEKLQRQAGFTLEEDLPYAEFVTLSYEAREKLDRIRPMSLAQAGRIPGVSPADLQNLMMEVKRWRGRQVERK